MTERVRSNAGLWIYGEMGEVAATMRDTMTEMMSGKEEAVGQTVRL